MNILVTILCVSGSGWAFLCSIGAPEPWATLAVFLLSLCCQHAFDRTTGLLGDLGSFDIIVPWLALLVWLAELLSQYQAREAEREGREGRLERAGSMGKEGRAGGSPGSPVSPARGGRRRRSPPSSPAASPNRQRRSGSSGRERGSGRKNRRERNNSDNSDRGGEDSTVADGRGGGRAAAADQFCFLDYLKHHNELGAILSRIKDDRWGTMARVLVLLCSGCVLLIWRSVGEHGMGVKMAIDIRKVAREVGADPNGSRWTQTLWSEVKGVTSALVLVKIFKVAARYALRLLVFRDLLAHDLDGSTVGAKSGSGSGSGIDEESDGEGEVDGEDGGDGEDEGGDGEGGAGEGEWSRRRRATIDAQWLEGKRGRGAALSLAALWAVGAAVVAVLRRSPGGTTLLVRFGTQWLWGITVLDFVWCYVRFQIAKRTGALPPYNRTLKCFILRF